MGWKSGENPAIRRGTALNGRQKIKGGGSTGYAVALKQGRDRVALLNYPHISVVVSCISKSEKTTYGKHSDWGEYDAVECFNKKQKNDSNPEYRWSEKTKTASV